MNEKEISILIKKAEELRALFILGQRVIPFLEEIFVFVSEIEPVLYEINTSIKDNLKKMPKASKQLSKVTEATELATTEILDILDGLTYKNDIINSNLCKIKDLTRISSLKPLEVFGLLRDSISEGVDLKGILPEIDSMIEIVKSQSLDSINKVIDHTIDLNNSIINDSSSITMSLQVQDITSQQIAAVNNLLETVQSKLSVIIDKFQTSEFDTLVKDDVVDKHTQVSMLHRKIAYDPDAVDSFENIDVKQINIDKLIDEITDNPDLFDESSSSQDDIDNIFNKINGNSEQKPEITSIKKEVVVNNEVAFSKEQNDVINNMGELDDEISQDDIDALFGK